MEAPAWTAFPSVCRQKIGHAPELPHLRPRPADAPAAGPPRLALGRPPRLVRDRRGERARPRALLRRLPRRRPRRRRPRSADGGDPFRLRLRLRGRRALLAGNRAPLPRVERERAERLELVARDRAERLETCRRRLAEDWRAERRANQRYAAYRARGGVATDAD